MPEIISPNTGRPIGHWNPTPDAEIARAIERLPNAMRELADALRRKRLLSELASTLAQRKPALTRIIVDEVGKTPEEAASEVDYAVSFLTYGANVTGHAAERSSRSGDRGLRVVPAGPALLIAPFNDPLAGITRKIAPAIAAGCPAIVKPSSLGDMTARALFEAVDEAGLSGMLTLVNHTDRSVLDRLARAPELRVLSFTGSTETGVALAAAAAGSLKRLVLELGGNNPFLVLDGADIERAVADAIARKIRAAGQACSAENRIYVVAPLFNAFRDRLLDGMAGVTYGASDQGVAMGPVRTRAAIAHLEKLTQASAARGAVHSLGTSAGHQDAWTFAPTVVESDDALREQEAFGPLMSITKVASRSDALAIAAAEKQALACYVYGEVRADELAPLRFGSVGLNTTKIQGPDVPTGGFGTAGVGREGSAWGLEEYLTTINERWA